MGNMAYLFSDYIKDLLTASITITNEDTSYPKANCQNEQVANCTRTTNKTNIKVQLELGSAKQLKAWFIGNHNFSSGAAQINSYTASDFSTGKTQEVLDWTRREFDMFALISTPSSRQYWEIDLSSGGSLTSVDTYFEFGRIMCYDNYTALSGSLAEDWKRQRGYEFKNIVNETTHGIRWVHKLYGRREKYRLEWSIRPNSEGMPSNMRTLYETVNGRAHPFVYVPDVAVPAEIHYVNLGTDELKYIDVMDGAYAGNIIVEMIEAVRGKA